MDAKFESLGEMLANQIVSAFKEQQTRGASGKGLQYFFPISRWVHNYNFQLLKSDVVLRLTIASLAIPQEVSYAKLANLPLIIGLY